VTIESPWMTAREAAAYLKVSRSFLTAHLSEISHTRAGRDLRFTQAALDAHLARGRKQPMAAAEPMAAPARLRRITPGRMNPITRREYSTIAPRTEKAI